MSTLYALILCHCYDFDGSIFNIKASHMRIKAVELMKNHSISVDITVF